MAECIGKLASVEIEQHIETFEEKMDNSPNSKNSPNLRMVMAIAVGFVVTNDNQNQVRSFMIQDFAPLLHDPDLDVRTQAWKTLAYIGRNFSKVVIKVMEDKHFLTALDLVLPYNEKFIKITDLGMGGKSGGGADDKNALKDDMALDLRNTAYRFL